MNAITQVIDRFLAGEQLTRDEIFFGILLIGFVIASLQLVVMLVTRWGDRNPTSKALFFSILVHLSTTSGLVVYRPSVSVRTAEVPEPAEELVIEDIAFEAHEEWLAKEAGNAPWERLPSQDPLDFQRERPIPLDAQPLSDLNRTTPNYKLALNTSRQAEIRPWEEGLPDVLLPPADPNRQSETPEFDDPEVSSADNPERRDEQTASRPVPFRRRRATDGDGRPDVDRRTASGSVDRLMNRFDPAERMAFNAPKEDAEPTIRPDDDDRLQNRFGPEQVPDIGDTAGLNSEENGRGKGEELPGRSPFVRRAPSGRRNLPAERNRNDSPERRANDVLRRPSRLMAERNRNFLPERTPEGPEIAKADTESALPRASAPDLPSLYQRRRTENRLDIARKNGGTQASEEAVERSLKWLASVQEPDGRWDSSRWGGGTIEKDDQGIDRRFAGREADAGVTALSILAFLGAGYTHEKGDYRETVQKAIDWLLKNQRENGYLGHNATHYAKMYSHGMAAYALAEAYGMSTPEKGKLQLRTPLVNAIGYTLAMQNPKDGGWRYERGQDGDMSMFGWQLMALRSAELSGIPIPEGANTQMMDFLRERSLGQHGGLAAYRPRDQITAPMTAEALFCKQMFRLPRDHASSKEAVGYLMRNLPRRSELNLYYWYYGTLAMFQYGGDEWDRWNNAYRDVLIGEQVRDGDLAGSWEPRGPWGPLGGRIYSTAVATLCLEAYYRFLPLYRLGDSDRTPQP